MMEAFSLLAAPCLLLLLLELVLPALVFVLDVASRRTLLLLPPGREEVAPAAESEFDVCTSNACRELLAAASQAAPGLALNCNRAWHTEPSWWISQEGTAGAEMASKAASQKGEGVCCMWARAGGMDESCGGDISGSLACRTFAYSAAHAREGM